MDAWGIYPMLFVAGLVAGILNVLAGGGSFMTLPLLIFAGLPAGVANATNRVGILLQNIAAVWSFQRQGWLPRGTFATTALPSVAGGAFGAWLALQISDAAFQKLLAVLMVAFTLVTVLSSSRKKESDSSDNTDGDRTMSGSTLSGGILDGSSWRRFAIAAGFFVAGIYAGFVQAGVGFLFLALTTMAGFDLVRGNALKLQAILFLTVVALGLFAWQGRIDWPLGLALGSGQLFGGLLGVRLTVLKGHEWIRRFVLVMVVLFAIKLWIGG